MGLTAMRDVAGLTVNDGGSMRTFFFAMAGNWAAIWFSPAGCIGDGLGSTSRTGSGGSAGGAKMPETKPPRR